MAGYPYNKNFRKPQQGNAQNNNSPWALKPLFGKYEEGKGLVIKLQGFKWEDIGVLNQIDTSTFVVKKIKAKSGNDIIVLVIPSNKLTDFSNLLPQIKQQLAATGHYTKDSVNMFPEIIDNIIEKTASPEDIETSNKNIIKNWKELLQKIQDPEFRKKFLMVQVYPGNFNFDAETAKELKHAMLSPRNVMKILSQDPLATFVTDAPTWRREFNRTVNPGSPFVVYTQGVGDNNKFWNDPKIVDAKKRLAAKGKAINVDNLKAELGKGVYWALWKQHQTSSSYGEFYEKKGYDVRFTTPMDPNNDPFMKIANVVNNLTGELNPAAMKAISDEMAASGLTVPSQEDFNKKVEGLEGQGDLIKLKDFILAKCKKADVNVVEVGSTEEVISNALYAYGLKIAEEMNMLKQDAKNAFASALVLSVCSQFNIQTQKVNQCGNIISHFTDSQLEDVIMKIFQTYLSFANFKVNEGVGDGNAMSFEEFKNFIHSFTKNKSSIKRDFDDMTNRMNNPYNE